MDPVCSCPSVIEGYVQLQHDPQAWSDYSGGYQYIGIVADAVVHAMLGRTVRMTYAISNQQSLLRRMVLEFIRVEPLLDGWWLRHRPSNDDDTSVRVMSPDHSIRGSVTFEHWRPPHITGFPIRMYVDDILIAS